MPKARRSSPGRARPAVALGGTLPADSGKDRRRDRTSDRAVLGTAFLLLAIATLPQALIGGLSVPMSRELGVDERGIGLAVSAFWVGAGLAAPSAGRLCDRVGWIRVAAYGLLACGAAQAGLGIGGRSLAGVVVTMVLAGIGVALCSQASNLALVTDVASARLGRAFGIKQSAPALAWFLAGLAGPLVALTWGWRSAWLIGALAVPLVAMLVLRAGRRNPRVARVDEQRVPADGPGGALASSQGMPRWTLVVAFGLGTAAISALSTFGLAALVRAGLGQSTAGYVAAGAGALALVGRVAAGAWLDRGESTMRPAAGLLLASMIGLLLLATGQPGAAVVGLVLALACGSGWPPVVLVMIVRTWSERPGRATGTTSVGAAAGSIIGPLVFGTLAASVGYPAAWSAIAVMAFASSVMMLMRLQPLVGLEPGV